MADVKISALPATSTLAATDLVPVVQGGTTKALSPTTVGSNLVTLANPSAITFPKIAANNTVATESAKTHRVSIGLDQRTGVADSDYNVLATDRVVSYTSISAARVVNLPAASSFNAGQEVIIGDTSGSCSATKTITITRAGADTIDGATTEVIAAAYGKRRLISDGVSVWGFDKGVLRASNNLSDVTTAATARSNLSAAASGANADITSASGVTGAISAPTEIDFSGGTKLTGSTANTLEQVNGTTAQMFHLYNTFTNGSNYERLEIGPVSGTFKIVSAKAGSGQSQALQLIAAGNLLLNSGGGFIQFNNGANVWYIDPSGNGFKANTDNSWDIGAAGATRPRTGYFGTSVLAPSITHTALTVGTLPTANTHAGTVCYVTDGDSGLAWGATAVNTGSGATPYLVWSNGTAWTVAGK